MRIAITGHRGLPSDTERLVDQAIRNQLAESVTDDHLIGVSILADGADQIFARAITDLGGTLEVIIPAAQYRDRLPKDAKPEYDSLIAQAQAVRELPYTESDSEAHMAASILMVDTADMLYAVWDGLPARSYGGTADVVAYARQHGIPVQAIWPDGARRGT